MARPPEHPDPTRRLLDCWARIAPAERETLLAFAEFLAARASGTQPMTAEPAPVIPEPRPMPRPANETVIGAIRRLAQSYDMLDRAALLHEAAALMSAHVLEGRPAPEVIDELEALFARHYQAYRARLADPRS